MFVPYKEVEDRFVPVRTMKYLDDLTLLLLVKITNVIFCVNRECLGSNVNVYGGF